MFGESHYQCVTNVRLVWFLSKSVGGAWVSRVRPVIYPLADSQEAIPEGG